MEREDIEIDEQETSRLVRYVASVLEEAGGAEGMNLLEFIINPHDFGQSVENFFYLSFLVKENRACIELNGHEPTVCKPLPCSPAGRKADRVAQMRASRWMEMKDRRTSWLPSRSSSSSITKCGNRR